ncbi:hypothetical protein EAG_13491 [Camponotus floridanus]|uniref:Uncharacterized protein n=1 Tax=Camponotus floridanus TaxID=104421 RepID=E2AC23_CAMFO|nr:hypothetical protein EAG_13491 [Camponotus floridanus]
MPIITQLTRADRNPTLLTSVAYLSRNGTSNHRNCRAIVRTVLESRRKVKREQDVISNSGTDSRKGKWQRLVTFARERISELDENVYIVRYRSMFVSINNKRAISDKTCVRNGKPELSSCKPRLYILRSLSGYQKTCQRFTESPLIFYCSSFVKIKRLRSTKTFSSPSLGSSLFQQRSQLPLKPCHGHWGLQTLW